MSLNERRDGAPGPVSPRQPHDFDEIYQGKPAWDIDRPQPAFAELTSTGALRDRVLDVGCGTGEHALMAAAAGCDVAGVDMAAAAIALAERKAANRGLTARFLVANALELCSLHESFDSVLDSGLFHVFDDADRVAFVKSLASVIPAGGRYFMLCFSDQEPGGWGPRRITRHEITATFSDGWSVDSITPSTMDINIDPERVRAWLAVITRT